MPKTEKATFLPSSWKTIIVALENKLYILHHYTLISNAFNFNFESDFVNTFWGGFDAFTLLMLGQIWFYFLHHTRAYIKDMCLKY